MSNLTYRLKSSQHWRIYSVISIAHLEFSSFSASNEFLSQSIFMNNDSANVKSFEIEKLIVKKLTKRDLKYFVKWLKCELKKNVWRNLSKLDNVIKLIQKFENIHFELSTIFSNLTIKRDHERLKKMFI